MFKQGQAPCKADCLVVSCPYGSIVKDEGYVLTVLVIRLVVEERLVLHQQYTGMQGQGDHGIVNKRPKQAAIAHSQAFSVIDSSVLY